ncbi:MAG TPA: bifunctional YncE family protein/alkaline phosphatase family protein [Sunxiuqinia sp.]|nr:bifunctional YncE family protein/alkaline phosphatase family protein [Sunxiuqinia sp.]
MNQFKNTSRLAIAFTICLFSSFPIFAQTPGKVKHSIQILLPNGWKLTPAGSSITLGDFPLNLKVSPDGKYAAVTNNGQSTQSVELIDPHQQKVLDEKIVKESWYGLAFSEDEEHLYASGGNDNIILDFHIKQNKLGTPDTLKLGLSWPKEKISPTGIALAKVNPLMYVVTKEDNRIYIIDLKSKTVIDKVDLPGMGYSCVLSPNEKTLYVSIWGQDEVVAFNTESKTISATIKTGDHPNELLLNRESNVLYVANSNSNSVSVINTQTNKVIETLSAALYPTHLTGSTTNGLALSPDEEKLYIANADNNCLAVFDVSEPGNTKSKGFIPVGWYPTNVKVLDNKILVTNGKGFHSMPNPDGPQPIKKNDDSGYQKGVSAKKHVQYIGGLFKGTLSFIDVPLEEQMKNYTSETYANTPFNNQKEKVADGEAGNPIPQKVGQPSPIKHVFYIIKENRTYDQVLGDVKAGNGDDSLCIFGKNITPNQHALTKDFVLLDNFYVDAEVSADGHNWSTAAYATDVVEKTWPTYYGSHGGTYFYEGEKEGAYPRDGFIWNYCQRAGISYRSYGEFSADGKTPLKALEGHICPQSPGFDMTIKDQVRMDIWQNDFDSLVAINQVPKFSTIRFSNDHTSGQQKGAYTPQAAVADNDLAVGRFLDHLSHSPIWKESVVFILEDDAQNGPDHVDAHRSPVYLAGPYVKRNAVIHNMYSTSGVLRTIELILGLPPMSQYDAAAAPLYKCFTNKPDFTPFSHHPSNINLNQRNTADNASSRKSATFNFAHEDAVPDLELNEVVWKAMKGEDSEMPAPKRSAFVILEKKVGND